MSVDTRLICTRCKTCMKSSPKACFSTFSKACTNKFYNLRHCMYIVYLFHFISDENENITSVKKPKLSVHERLGKQLSDDRKVVTKSKITEEEDSGRPSKKIRLEEKPKIRSSVVDKPRTEKRRTSDESDQRSSKSGMGYFINLLY